MHVERAAGLTDRSRRQSPSQERSIRVTIAEHVHCWSLRGTECVDVAQLHAVCFEDRLNKHLEASASGPDHNTLPLEVRDCLDSRVSLRNEHGDVRSHRHDTLHVVLLVPGRFTTTREVGDRRVGDRKLQVSCEPFVPFA